MSHSSVVVFVGQELPPAAVTGKTVIEIGSYGGEVRSLVETWKPARYVGIDITSGPGVDMLCSAEDAAERLAPEQFDIVLSTEVLEHVRNWRAAVHSMKALCRPGGRILFTTRSEGYPYHTAPADFWRYSLDDVRTIFSDCEMSRLVADPAMPGVFASMVKPPQFVEATVPDVALFSMITRSRVADLDNVRVPARARIRLLGYRVSAAAGKRLTRILNQFFG